jgi:hypothetical protein
MTNEEKISLRMKNRWEGDDETMLDLPVHLLARSNIFTSLELAS